MLAIVQIARLDDAMSFDLARDLQERKKEGARDMREIRGGYIKILAFFGRNEEEMMYRAFSRLLVKNNFNRDNFQIMDIDI
ncbi:MAG: hypothetical protein AB1465_03610 [Patescibacteria group bacterium]